MSGVVARAVFFLLTFLAASSALAGGSKGRLAAWVVRDRLTSPEAVEEVCRQAKEAGIDTLIVQVRGRGDAYYRSELAPRAEALASAPDGFDPLAEVLRRAKGMRVIAWLNVFLVWSGDKVPSEDSHVFWAPEDWILEDRDGREVWTYSPRDRALGWLEGTYVDPESPEYRAHFALIAAEVAKKYRVDGIHLDFVRYPGAGYGMGGPLGERYRQEWGLDARWIPEDSDSLSPSDLLAGAASPSKRVLATASLFWRDLRANQVTELVRTVRRKLNSLRRKVELSAAVFPNPGDAYLDKGQDWATWAAEGLVDALFPMVYFGGPERVGAQLTQIAEVLKSRAPKVRLWAGLGGYIKEPSQIGEEARTAWSLGCTGVCLFDLGTLRQKPAGARAYYDAVRRERKTSHVKLRGVPRSPPKLGDSAALVRALDRASGRRITWGKRELQAAEVRWTEFLAARRTAIPTTIDSLSATTCLAPEWADLKGVFRYVNPGDGEERRQAQRAMAEDALVRLQVGEDLGMVAKELSQWGSRGWGGALKRRYLEPSATVDKVLQTMAPGELSPVLETPGGFWVYRLEAKGGGEMLPVSDMPWPAKRLLFKHALSVELDAVAGAAGRSSGASQVN